MPTPDPTSISLAFTTRLPLAVMIVLGIKQWENRSAMPFPAKGRCAMSVSKGSSEAEYSNFLSWAHQAFPPEWLPLLPPWETVAHWRGQIIATCNYEASTSPGPKAWDEGYDVWWKLSDVHLLEHTIPCKGSVGMWRMAEEMGKVIDSNA